jgi:hypothetical protein
MQALFSGPGVWARGCRELSNGLTPAQSWGRLPQTRRQRTSPSFVIQAKRSALQKAAILLAQPGLIRYYRIPLSTPTMILRSSWLLATLVPCVFADVKFTSPAAGATVSGPTISIEWEESGNPPKIADLASYQLFLCAGGNDKSSYVYCPSQSRRFQSLTPGRYNSPPL